MKVPLNRGIFFCVVTKAIAKSPILSMIVIKVEKILQEKERRLKEKPVVKIILPTPSGRSDFSQTGNEEQQAPVITQPRRTEFTPEEQEELYKKALLSDLECQDHEIRIDRAKLSNQYMPMIQNGATQDELAAHYAKIEALTKELQGIYDKSEYVKRYGRLPNERTAAGAMDETSILALKDRKRKLVDKRSKLTKKIAVGEAKKAPKLNEWKMELDVANQEYTEVERKLRELRHE